MLTFVSRWNGTARPLESAIFRGKLRGQSQGTSGSTEVSHVTHVNLTLVTWDDREYPWAVAGINITSMVLDVLQLNSGKTSPLRM